MAFLLTSNPLAVYAFAVLLRRYVIILYRKVTLLGAREKILILRVSR